MIRKLIPALAVALALIVGVWAGAAYATEIITDRESTSFSLDVKEVRRTYMSPAWGTSSFKAQCPAGYSPVGGGGQAIDGSGGRLALMGSAPYDDGNLGWLVTFAIPQSWSGTVYVYANCMDIA